MLQLYAILVPQHFDEENFNYLKTFVSEKRQNRIEKYYKREDKLRSLLAELLLRYVLQKNVKMNGQEIQFSYNEWGKPELCGQDRLYFNLSHSGNWVICGVGDSILGVDVEESREKNLNLAERFFAAEEYEEILSHPKEEQLKQFYKYWTLKESYTKAEGKGLSIPLDSFLFRFYNEDIMLITDGVKADEYLFQVYEIDELHTAAVCWTGSREELFQTKINCISVDEIMQWKFN
ncbi:4'-phosphopantetheinyl transferase family protein [Anaeromicropila populeti]|uniref:4'-phosphopantetheinyl transferase n=1 Tax=Anaeromicropila populeti TaxID=37658 RepID=A0A1I6JMW8_9FIRM|nr:4'-phosphopantetheinyl transferase superfamily protein [Anaeromicropila populeti]SFR79910.1 4'-phosphopantetheinyl transferase [Anaeromicropila populeti]